MKSQHEPHSPSLSLVLAVATGLFSVSNVLAQDAPPAVAVPPSAAAAAAGGISAEQMAKANNPLADMNALNFQNSWISAIRGLPNDTINTMNVRPVMVAGRQIIRATIPLATVPLGGGPYASGVGDINIFDAIKITGEGSKTDIALGPLLVIPSASNDALGQGKWQAGGAVVAIHPLSGGSLVGALITYQTDFAGDKARAGTSILAAQPIVTMSMGGGYYARSSAVMVFDLQNHRSVIPFGIGFGRVFKGMGGVVNAFVEPQFTVYSKGDQQPAFQLFTGLNMQWGKKPKG